MAQNMRQYIGEQPTVWRRILANPPVIYTEEKIERVLLVGSGSSRNAALCAQKLYEEVCGLPTTVVSPTDLSGVLLIPPQGTLVLAVSQSGRSTNTLAAVSTLQSAGFNVYVLTADEASPLAKLAEHILIDCGEETVGPKTKGMTATVLALYLIGMACARSMGKLTLERESEVLTAFAAAFAAAEENLLRCEAFCREHQETLAAQPHFTLISDGIGFPVAMESALKILETLYVPAFAFEFEEYLHGVNNTIAPGCCNLLFPTGRDNLGRMQTLDNYSAKLGCLNFTVTALDTPLAGTTLRLSGGDCPYTAVFTQMLFSQLLSALGSEAKGIDCDKPKFTDFYSVMQTKVRT